MNFHPIWNFVFETQEDGQKALELLHKVYFVASNAPASPNDLGSNGICWVSDIHQALDEVNRFVVEKSAKLKNPNGRIRELLTEIIRLLGD